MTKLHTNKKLERLGMLRNLVICAIFAASLFAETVFAQTIFAQTMFAQTTPAQTTPAQTKAPTSKAPAAGAAKSPTPAPAPSGQSDKKPSTTSPDAASDPAVITVHGLCGKRDKAAAADACFTTVGRDEFDKVTQAVTKPDQQLAPGAKRALAEKYVELLVFANAAKEAGVDQSAEFAASLYLLQLRTLAEFYQRQLEIQYRNPAPAEIDAYYKEHAGDFVSVNVSRVYVPRNDPSGKATTPEQKTAFSTRVQQVSDEMRDRAAKGENLEKLQKECYEKLGISSAPPSTTIGAIRKGSLPAADDKQMFALAPGGVFKSEAAGAYTIYKVDSKQALTQESVKDEIARVIYRQKMEKRIKELNASVKTDLDDKYFGPAAATPAPDRR
jgi:hypothetical protein